MLKAIESHNQLFSNPFSVGSECTPEQLQEELAELQYDSMSKLKYKDIGIPDFYRFLSRERFSHVHSAVAAKMAMFGSTYMIQRVFSFVKLNKSSLSTKPYEEQHLQAKFRVAASQEIRPTPIINVLADRICRQSSRQKMNILLFLKNE